MFLVNIPIVIGALFFAKVLVPESRDPEAPRIDIVGAVLSIVGLTDRRVGPDRGVREGLDRPDHPRVRSPSVQACSRLFLVWERRVQQPMIDIAIFRNLRFSAASLSITLVFFGLMGTIFMLTTYLQTVLGYTAARGGLSDDPGRRRPDHRRPVRGRGGCSELGAKLAVAGWSAHRRHRDADSVPAPT